MFIVLGRSASAVGRLRKAGKLVLAYVDVGEAESYRSYWRASWRIGTPVYHAPVGTGNQVHKSHRSSTSNANKLAL